MTGGMSHLDTFDPKPGNEAMGPTGAIGNIWGRGTGDPTVNTRMIQIREVLPETPAAGVLEQEDVILGVISPAPSGSDRSGGRFDSDARKVLSAAITEAEKETNGGKLVLNVWRKGKTMPATLTLPVKGTYSASAPWDCEKTSVIIDEEAMHTEQPRPRNFTCARWPSCRYRPISISSPQRGLPPRRTISAPCSSPSHLLCGWR